MTSKNVGFPKMLVLYYIYNITHQVLYLKNNITPQDHLGGGELLYYIYNITNHLLYYIYIYKSRSVILYATQESTLVHHTAVQRIQTAPAQKKTTREEHANA